MKGKKERKSQNKKKEKRKMRIDAQIADEMSEGRQRRKKLLPRCTSSSLSLSLSTVIDAETIAKCWHWFVSLVSLCSHILWCNRESIGRYCVPYLPSTVTRRNLSCSYSERDFLSFLLSFFFFTLSVSPSSFFPHRTVLGVNDTTAPAIPAATPLYSFGGR